MQIETADRISELTESALDQLQANLAAGRSDTLKAYLATMAKFHRYSFGNQVLIAFQRPDARQVAGFHAWRKLGRFVNKGEKGILIIAPCPRPCPRKAADASETDEQGDRPTKSIRRVMGFRGVTVFDISQTDGVPLPEFAGVGGDPSFYMQRLYDAISESSIIRRRVTSMGGAHGLSLGGEIHILDGLSPAAEFSVTVHEYAHEMMHRTERRASTTVKIRETEAEAVAFVVCHAIGLETGTASSDYLCLYNGELDTLTESLQIIRDTASSIIGKLKLNDMVSV